MLESDPKVIFVIPTMNRSQDLHACLLSIERMSVLPAAVIVVDNGSDDDTIEVVNAQHPQVELIALEENLGATGASNRGFERALSMGAEYVLRLDSDTEVAPDFLDTIIKFAIEHPDGGVFSPKIYYYDPPDRIWYAGADAHPWHMGAIHVHRGETDSPANSLPKKVDYVWAAAMLIKREALLKVGGFDEDFLVYQEELDYCQRVRSAGFELWIVPQAKIWHKVFARKNTPWQTYQWNRNKMLFYRKNSKNGLHRLSLILYAFAYALFRSVFPKEGVGNRGSLGQAIKGLFAGLHVDIKQGSGFQEKGFPE